MTKPKFRFEKPIIKSKTEPASKNVLWYFSQQKRGLTINTIKEYIKSQGWVDLFDTAPIELEEVTFTENGIYENNEKGWGKVIVDTPSVQLTNTLFSENGVYINDAGGWNRVEVNIQKSPLNNEIWYTSINNQICNITTIPSQYTLVSNTYSEGKGVFTFNKPLTDLSGFVFSNEYFTTITFPEKVENGMFCLIENCKYLYNYNIPEGIVSDIRFCFDSPPLFLNIPSTMTTFWESGSLSGFAKQIKVKDMVGIEVSPLHPFYDSRDNCNAIIDTRSNALCLGCKNTIIPESVTAINEYAFSNCVNLKSIIISDNVTNIYTDAFKNCKSLKYIYIGKNMDYIQAESLWGSPIESVHWNAIGAQNSDYFKSGAPFSHCLNNITHFVFGDDVENIPGYLCSGMDNWHSDSIEIPKKVKRVGPNAFASYYLKNIIMLPDNPPVIYTAENGGEASFWSNYKFYVPDEFLEVYKTDTNWVVYADNIYPMSQYQK